MTQQLAVTPNFEAYDGLEPYCFVSHSHANSDRVYDILNLPAERLFRTRPDGSRHTRAMKTSPPTDHGRVLKDGHGS